LGIRRGGRSPKRDVLGKRPEKGRVSVQSQISHCTGPEESKTRSIWKDKH